MAKWMFIIGGVLASTMAMALPNPSWVYCLEKGGNYETRVDGNGNQDGVCMFMQDNVASECGGWAYFRGDCAPGECLHWSVDLHACEIAVPIE